MKNVDLCEMRSAS